MSPDRYPGPARRELDRRYLENLAKARNTPDPAPTTLDGITDEDDSLTDETGRTAYYLPL